MIKKNWSILLLVVAIIAAVAILSRGKKVKKGVEGKILLTTKAFATNNGWGYDVLTNDTVYIHQQYIPAVEGYQSFATEQQALETGNLVIQKLKRNTSPTITLQDLDSLKVQHH